MKTALLIGATGLTGNHLLKLLLNTEEYKKVIIFVRRDAHIQHPKLEQHIIDFDQLHTYAHLIQGDHLYNCMGTTIKKAKTKENFAKIDFQIPLSIAQTAKKNGIKKMLSISSIMANPQASSHYLCTKGKLELALKDLNFESFITLQPSLLTGNRSEFRFTEKLTEILMTLLNPLLIGKLKNFRSIPITTLAQAMLKLALTEQKGFTTITSQQIPQLAS